MSILKDKFFETLVGLGVVLIAVGFTLFGFSQQNFFKTGSAQFPLIAKFSRVDGLRVGSEVRLGGISIGKVTSLDLDAETYLAIVGFEVLPTLVLPVDSIASISSDGLMGGKFLDLTPGGSVEKIHRGGEIRNTQPAVRLESLLGQLIFKSTSSSSSSSSATISGP